LPWPAKSTLASAKPVIDFLNAMSTPGVIIAGDECKSPGGYYSTDEIADQSA
jgi:hypothetical protein